MCKIFLYYGVKRQIMKSISNTQKRKLGTISIFITMAMIAVTPVVMSTDVYAQRESRSAGLADGDGDDKSEFFVKECRSKILTDSPEGEMLGWTPDGNDVTFTIEDKCYYKDDSTVLINVVDGGANFEVCNVDFADDKRFFEVFCNAPPAEGSELHYIIFVDEKSVVGMEAPTPEEEKPSAVLEREQQNSTQQ